MKTEPQTISVRLGFREGFGGVHLARTMMLDDLRRALDHVGQKSTSVDALRASIIDDNLLGRTTMSARRRAARLLPQLYGIDDHFALFRAFRTLAARDGQSLPALALLLAMARDSVLRDAMPCISAVTIGSHFEVSEVVTFLRVRYGPQYSEASLRSIARNLASSWEQARLLHGVVRKERVRLAPRAASVAFAVFLGWLHGARGIGLFQTPWAGVFDASLTELRSHTLDAGYWGMLRIAALGDVVDVSFPGWLTPDELRMLDEQARSAA